jgi:hypothetical protein
MLLLTIDVLISITADILAQLMTQKSQLDDHSDGVGSLLNCPPHQLAPVTPNITLVN